MERSPEGLYLDLMKKTLSFALWPQPPSRVEMADARRSLPKQLSVSVLSRLLARRSIVLCHEHKTTSDQIETGRYNFSCPPAYADTLIGLTRLNNIQLCVETVLQDGIEGDLIETGVWKGGSCIFMRAILAAHGVKDRKVYVADSFEGMPRRSLEQIQGRATWGTPRERPPRREC